MSGAQLVPHTRHSENETLFWTKAASVLGLPQVGMPNSEVPLSRNAASRDLKHFMAENLPGFDRPLNSEADFFAAWTALACHYGPILLEKSPHHLYQPSVVELLERFADAAKGTEVRFIGLVRNPPDTLYSSWRRFGIAPHVEEAHWIRAYRTLRDFERRRPDLVTVLRYEDLVDSDAQLARVIGDRPITPSTAWPASDLHGWSLQKWRRDESYGFSPSAEAIDLAIQYGYSEDELLNPNAGPWFLRRTARATAYSMFSILPPGTQTYIRSTARRVLGRKAAR